MTAPVGRDGFGHQVRAEWTKLRSIRRWVFALAAAGVLGVLLSLLVASGSGTDANRYPTFVTGPDGEPVADEFEFAHQRVSGDVTITARVVTQADSHRNATAGLMIKDGVRSGSRYAALALTPGNGVRLQADFTTDRYAGPGRAGYWLRLTRTGGTVTGQWSADGRNWRSAKLPLDTDLPDSVDVGLFVSSPPRVIVERQAGMSSAGEQPTIGRATFDNVSIGGAPPELQAAELGGPVSPPDEPGARPEDSVGVTESGGVYVLTGSGKIGPNPPDDDIVQVSLVGILAVVIVLISVSALFVTSEFKHGLMRTTFTAGPRRGRMLAAKAIVLGGVGFTVGLTTSVTAFFAAQPLLRDRGWTPPAFPAPSVTDPAVLRALLTTSVFVAAVALLALGIGTITRHSAAAIGPVIALVILPLLVASALPTGAARLLMQLTPAGGFATQRVKPPTVALVDPSAMLSPWWGLGVACVYAAAALIVAGWLLQRRDA